MTIASGERREKRGSMYKVVSLIELIPASVWNASRRNGLICIAALLLAIHFSGTSASAVDIRIRVVREGSHPATTEVTFDDGIAVVTHEGTTERFDLANERWRDGDKWQTLADAKKWAKQWKEANENSEKINHTPYRDHNRWRLNPTYKTTRTEAGLVLESGHIDLRISGNRPDESLADLLTYLRLDAYKKSMQDDSMPPFSWTLAIDEIERAKLQPKLIEMTFPQLIGSFHVIEIHFDSVTQP